MDLGVGAAAVSQRLLVNRHSLPSRLLLLNNFGLNTQCKTEENSLYVLRKLCETLLLSDREKGMVNTCDPAFGQGLEALLGHTVASSRTTWKHQFAAKLRPLWVPYGLKKKWEG